MHYCGTETLMGSSSGSLKVISGKLVMSSPPWLPNCLATRSSSAAKASWRGGEREEKGCRDGVREEGEGERRGRKERVRGG